MANKRGWGEEKNGTFKKRFSGKMTGRTQSTYTLRGRDISLQNTLRKLAKEFKTLGSGNLLRIVDVPTETEQEAIDRAIEEYPDSTEEEQENIGKTEAENEWLAANTVDFYNEVALLYGIVEEFHQKSSDSLAYSKLKEEFKDMKKFPAFGNGFPQGFQYRIKSAKKDEASTGAEYVNLSMIWLEDQIDNPKIFPETAEDRFPPKFKDKYISEMFKRMFRIFAIIYAVCWPIVLQSAAEAHVNTCFKHFYFFMQRFQLLKKKGDRNVFVKTKVKNIIDLEALDKEYKKCQDEILGDKEEE